MTNTVQSTTRHQLTEADVRAEVRTVQADGASGEEFSDSAAVTVAAWWQSPGTVGHVLASLASGMAVDVEDLLFDIHQTRKEATTEEDRRALDCLATWALNHPSRTYPS